MCIIIVDTNKEGIHVMYRYILSGGTINESERELRVNSILATTRGLGNHGDVSLKKCVISEPYTTSVKIDQYAQFLILASNGVWEVFSEKDAASLLLQVENGLNRCIHEHTVYMCM